MYNSLSYTNPSLFSGAISLAGLASDFLDKGRQALEVAFQAQPDVWQTSLLLGCILVERDQREKAETALVAAINAQLVVSSPKDPKGGLSGAGNNVKGGLTGLLEEGVFDGYDSDKLCPHASPVSYAILASFFSLLRRPLPARKVHTLAIHTPLSATISSQYYRTFSV